MSATRMANSILRGTPVTGCATGQGRAHQSLQTHLLGWVHVPELRVDETEDVGRHSECDGEGARRSRLFTVVDEGMGSMAGEKKKLNVGVIGYGFMGRTHSNPFGR